MPKITINVRPQEDDSTNICTMCPVAQALREAVGLERATMKTASRGAAFAQPDRLFALSEKMTVACDTPPDVTAKIKRWDATGEMEPFSFQVNAATGRLPAPIEWQFPGCTPPSMRPRVA